MVIKNTSPEGAKEYFVSRGNKKEFQWGTCPAHVKHPFLSPLRGWFYYFFKPGASPLAICFLPFRHVVFR
ncbi:MAG: hypothetical protein NUV76_06665 [Candidatus Kuenenia sp.]|nr:hypothetical protein [Candidatus Kuenenia sp.]